MTEKRFAIAEYPTDIIDNKTGEKYPCSSYYTHMIGIVDLLNELHEENQEYKQKVKETLQKRYTHLQKTQQETEKPPRYWQGAIMEIEVVADCLGVDLE